MRPNPVKKTLREGGTSFGTFLFEFSSTGAATVAANSGAEFVIFDMEHTGWSVETIRVLLAATRSANTIPCVRVPKSEYHFIARVLDMGAMGIMVPMVESPEEAEHIVSCTRYPPQGGKRGAAFGMAHDDYSGGDIVEKMESAAREQLVFAQIETKRGLALADEIAAVDGVDVLWVGQTDLTTSLGIPGQFAHPKFLDALDRVAEAAREHGKTAGYMAMSVDEARNLQARGFRAISYAGDLYLYGTALRQGLDALKESPE